MKPRAEGTALGVMNQLSISKPVKQEKLMRSSEIFVSRKHFYCSNAGLLQICQKDLMESTQTAALQTVSVNAPDVFLRVFNVF